MNRLGKIRLNAAAGAAVCLAWAVLAFPSPLRADDAQAESLALEIRKLVRGLNSPELAQREQAEKRLIALGPAALDLLPEANDRMPAEVQHRLGRVRQRLEQALAEAAGQASRLSLHSEAMPLEDLLTKIKEQTGNEVADFRRRFGHQVKPIELKPKLENVDFWPALDALLDDAGLSVYHYSGKSDLALVERDPGQVPRLGRASYAGPLRIEATRVEAQRDLRLPGNSHLKLELEIAWEPRLMPIAISQRLAEVEAVDEDGQAILVPGEAVELEVPVRPGVSAVQLEIPLILPSREAAKIDRLKGKLAALVPGKVETFQFDQLDGAKGVQRKGSAVVAIDAVRQNNELWEVRMRVSFDKTSGALESHRGWIYRNECYLTDGQGKRIEHDGFEATRQAENEVGKAYLFDVPSLKDMTFVYKTPAAILTLPVEYELKDIELP